MVTSHIVTATEQMIITVFFATIAQVFDMRLSILAAVFVTLIWNGRASADDAVFSGPQAGEELPPLSARVVFGDDAGDLVNITHDVGDSPLLLVFVHQVTRPAIGLTRLLMAYANQKKADGLKSGLIFLSADATETEAWMRRARHALPAGVRPLISPDGIDGPGAYGLNRKMTLTVLVANEGKVTANFPLIQPSIQADAPQIGHAVIKVLGGEHTPTLREMGFQDRRAMQSMDGMYRRMMAPVIQKTASPDEVDKAAKAVEELAAKNKQFRHRVYLAAKRIIDSGRLANYGTPQAQQYLTRWAKEFAPNRDQPADDE